MAPRDLLRRSPAQEEWPVDPGFAAIVDEPPTVEPGAWAAAEPIEVTDHTVELPELAALPSPGRRRVWRAALTLALVLGCAGAAVAASGVLRPNDDMPAPVRIGASSSIATSPRHHVKPQPKPARRLRHHRRTDRHVAARPAPARPTAAAPARPAPARPAPVVHHVVSRPAPTPVAAPNPAPKPVPTKPTTTASQPAPSAPSGEPGRQPPPAP